MSVLRPVIVVTLGLWVLLGLAYPLVTAGVSGVVFPHQASASPVTLGGKVVAAGTVGQYFNQSEYFWGRPSATTSTTTGKPEPYNAYSSAPSNLGPTNRLLVQEVKQRIRVLLASTPGLKASQIPPDLVEASGSGLDPDISPQAAAIQIPRVAKATGIPVATLRRFVAGATQGPQFGLIGTPVVNVVDLNLQVYRALHAARARG